MMEKTRKQGKGPPDRPYYLVRWEGGPPCCVSGNLEEVKRKAKEDPRTKAGLQYVII